MIIAGIVTYNPDIYRLKENVNAILPQVDEIVCVDNSSENRHEILEYFLEESRIKFICNDKNTGIATALNSIMKYACDKKCEWVLTLDQDSVCATNIIKEYKKYINMEDVAMIAPVIQDRNCHQVEVSGKEYEDIDRCITSGALTNVLFWKAVGGYNEVLFIDYVDFDYCEQLHLINKKIIRVNTVVLQHEIGRAKEIRIFNKHISFGNHSPQRKYYIARNQLYYILKYKKYRNMSHEWLYLFELFAYVILFESEKILKLKMMIKGLLDTKSLR